ncbi:MULTISPECIES: O-antigen ligase [unclassified Bradyrhizobium]|uniref:O-antigen ligase family protein n=1 Tax=unclassified Bradyrhizobium TaxID=2631580 RepID=UPI001BA6327D|nr:MULTISPECIES: O-antigen ligase family protein [unclassified Bradyrhizobium]MBR1229231.1 O-antigen ligase family protein [Bradyrhizobium sp. AUGA SZCCT0176]MBR1302282.1 O-antigen ligase family protein [Bradyrhizobium sp. AUGA SZCCT0042]
MNAKTATSPGGQALPVWRDPAWWVKAADIFAVLIAFSLPWSTSLVGIFAVIWLLAVAPTLDLRLFLQSLKRPICALPIALFLLALVGTLWSDAPWDVRRYALSPATKLLVLPLLFYHFERSARGMWVLVAFLVSCALLMVMSWLVLIYPGLSLKPEGADRGIFVKNYIDQSQEFALCAVVLAYPVITLLRDKKFWQALLLISIAASLLANMAFVIVSRTALVTMPVMLAVFALMHLKWRTNVILFLTAIVLGGLAWIASPQLQATTDRFTRDYRLYKELNQPTSLGLRLVFWEKSLRFFAEAPIIGHGTGSTRRLFEAAATGPAGLAQGEVIGNPHNQTLNVAVQWGSVGVVLLYAMWLVHLLLFRGEGLVAWIGLMVVLQNFFSSLFNSHLFDFHEGWMYVLGVGVAGGMILRAKDT